MRTPEVHEAYEKYKREIGTPHWVNSRPKKEWEYWELHTNIFPYAWADIHDLLLPKRPFEEVEMAFKIELHELEMIENDITLAYDMKLVTTGQNRSVRAWYHVHYITVKPEFKKIMEIVPVF